VDYLAVLWVLAAIALLLALSPGVAFTPLAVVSALRCS
jgi:hypothetical protein